MSNPVTPRVLAERIIRLVERGNQPNDSQLDEREVISMAIDKANALAKLEMLRNDELRSVPSHYIHTFRRVPVKVLDSTGENFITLPSKYVNLPNAAGVQSIRPSTDNPDLNSEAFIPIMPGFEDVYAELISKSIQKRWGYRVEEDKVFFTKNCGQPLCDKGIEYVTVRMVVILGDILPDSPLSVPPELHDQIVAECVQFLTNRFGMNPVKDKTSDNNPDLMTQ